MTGLSRGDAEWVDVIHTNPGVLGKKDAIGDIDFYCNHMGLPLQPGSYDISSSHERAWRYYAESVYPGNENNFLAKKCSSLRAVDVKDCQGPMYAMGYATPFNLKGNSYCSIDPFLLFMHFFFNLKGIFFLRTNSDPPYGENSRKYDQPVCADSNRQRS